MKNMEESLVDVTRTFRYKLLASFLTDKPSFRIWDSVPSLKICVKTLNHQKLGSFD